VDWNFNSQVTAGDHYSIDFSNDFIDIRDPFLIFNFCNDFDFSNFIAK